MKRRVDRPLSSQTAVGGRRPEAVTHRSAMPSQFARRFQAPSATVESLKGVAGLGDPLQHGLVDSDRWVEAVDGARAVV